MRNPKKVAAFYSWMLNTRILNCNIDYKYLRMDMLTYVKNTFLMVEKLINKVFQTGNRIM